MKKTLFAVLAILTLLTVCFKSENTNTVSTDGSTSMEKVIGILPDILNTIYVIFTTLIFVLPIGLGAAIYLNEYAKNKKLVSAIEFASECLSGIPSIIYGLVGMLFFCQFLEMKTSLLAGSMTLVVLKKLI